MTLRFTGVLVIITGAAVGALTGNVALAVVCAVLGVGMYAAGRRS